MQYVVGLCLTGTLQVGVAYVYPFVLALRGVVYT